MRNLNIKNEKGFLMKFILILFIITSVIITQTGCGDKEPVSETQFCLNTTCDITIYDVTGNEGKEIVEGAFKEVRRYENLLSKTVEDSDIYRINSSAGKFTDVSGETVAVIEQGLKMGEISGGLFDITIGNVTELWDFTGENPHVPEAEELQSAISDVNYKSVIIEDNRVELKNSGAAIDLGGIAKGYIADKITDFLEKNGVKKAIINLGGNVVVIGEKDNDTPWHIGVERPYSDRTELVGSVKVTDSTLVTSGIYERKFEENGVIYHHVLDPKTGYPRKTDLESVTIKATKGYSGFCDGLSTICLMMGKDKAIDLVEDLQKQYPEMELEAAFIDRNDKMIQTKGMNVTLTEDK